jgi:hypothetical protein
MYFQTAKREFRYLYTPVQKDPHFLFLLSTTASPTICQAACTIEEGFISDYNRGFIFAHESGWQFKMDPHLSPLQKPERQRASRKGRSKGYG